MSVSSRVPGGDSPGKQGEEYSERCPCTEGCNEAGLFGQRQNEEGREGYRHQSWRQPFLGNGHDGDDAHRRSEKVDEGRTREVHKPPTIRVDRGHASFAHWSIWYERGADSCVRACVPIRDVGAVANFSGEPPQPPRRPSERCCVDLLDRPTSGLAASSMWAVCVDCSPVSACARRLRSRSTRR
jgi:hypothetical protein